MFGTINIAGMATFALLIPETKGRSLEEMDIIFGSVQASTREADIAKEERGKQSSCFCVKHPYADNRPHL